MAVAPAGAGALAVAAAVAGAKAAAGVAVAVAVAVTVAVAVESIVHAIGVVAVEGATRQNNSASNSSKKKKEENKQHSSSSNSTNQNSHPNHKSNHSLIYSNDDTTINMSTRAMTLKGASGFRNITQDWLPGDLQATRLQQPAVSCDSCCHCIWQEETDAKALGTDSMAYSFKCATEEGGDQGV